MAPANSVHGIAKFPKNFSAFLDTGGIDFCPGFVLTKYNNKHRRSNEAPPMRRPAFTLIELLVVMALIGTLMGLLLPAVQQVRQAAARTQSQNHLKQIGLALHQHHDVSGRFPPGYRSQTGAAGTDPATLDAPPGWAWSVFLLPYLEQQNLYAQLRLDQPCWHPVNQPWVQTELKVFLNPAAPNSSPTIVVRGADGSERAVLGRSHYVANAGHDEPWGYEPPLPDWRGVANGPFYRNSTTRIADVRDGLSQTVFVGEHTTISDKTWVGVVPGAIVCPIDPNRYPFSHCDRAATLVLSHSGPSAAEPGIIHPPSFPTAHVCQMYAPWPGGNVLFGDGSVRFIPTTIHLETWAAMTSMNGGEVVDGN